jgi:hypothetical protein
MMGRACCGLWLSGSINQSNPAKNRISGLISCGEFRASLLILNHGLLESQTVSFEK